MKVANYKKITYINVTTCSIGIIEFTVSSGIPKFSIEYNVFSDLVELRIKPTKWKAEKRQCIEKENSESII